MTGPMKLCGVILAAGASSRMGRDKALLPWPPAASENAKPATGTLLDAAIQSLKPHVHAVVVVGSGNAEKIAPIVAANGAQMAVNPAPERGQFSSLHVGLSKVRALSCNAAMIAPVDNVPLRVDSLQQLCTALETAQARGCVAVIPEHAGRHGHPLLAGPALVAAFLSAPLTTTARDVLRTYAKQIEYVEVPDALLGIDMNTPQQYAVMTAAFSTQSR